MIYGVFVQVHFYANQKEIVAIECENKDRPEMNCNGKCFLSKQLAKIDAELKDKKSQQENRISITKLLESELFYFQQEDLNIGANTVSLENSPNWKDNFNLRTSHLEAIEHPPCVMS
jgi:hypothetical protein